MNDPCLRLRQLGRDAAQSINSECTALLQLPVSSVPDKTARPLRGCPTGLLVLLQSQTPAACSSQDIKVKPITLKRLDDLMSIAYGRFHAYPSSGLPLHWRQLYVDAAILKFTCLFMSSFLFALSAANRPGTPPSDDGTLILSQEVDEMVRILDLAIIRAGDTASDRGKKWIERTLGLLETAWNHHRINHKLATAEPREPSRKKTKLSESNGWDSEPAFSMVETRAPPLRNPIRRISSWTIAQFEDHVNGTPPPDGPSPVIFTASMRDWPALTTNPWCKPAYLLSQTFGGRRLVPVEVGRSYVDAGWGQEVVSFGTFLDKYILSADAGAATSNAPEQASRQPTSSIPKGYLAQHELFTQIPQLQNDIRTPDYCWADVPPHPTAPTTHRQPKLEVPARNAWLGPAGTITPLHTDAYHNVLCQVVGRKYLRLYHPRHSARLRPRGVEAGVDMSNTSRLDVGVLEGWDPPPQKYHGQDETEDEDTDDDAQVDAFRDVPFVDCVLEPGDMLYIPIGWWHYVRSVTVSFSVSYWWN